MSAREEAIAFAVENAVGDFDEGLIRFLVERMMRREDGIFDRRGGEARVVAALIEGSHNAADAAELAMLGAAGADEAVVGHLLAMVPEALDKARAGTHAVLDVPLRGRLEGLGAAEFGRLGFAIAYREYAMHTRDATRPAAVAVPEGLSWVELDARRAERVYTFLVEAFAGVPGFMAAPPEEMARRLMAHVPRPRVLVDVAGDQLVGIARVKGPDGDGVGKVDLVARAASRRGHGLGRVVLDEALRVLAELGARRFSLDVAADNERALKLYRAYGFEIVAQDTVWRRGLRSED